MYSSDKEAHRSPAGCPFYFSQPIYGQMMTPGLRERQTEPPPGADRDGSHCRLWVLGDTGMHACGALPSRPAFVQMGVCHGFPDMGLPLPPLPLLAVGYHL